MPQLTRDSTQALFGGGGTTGASPSSSNQRDNHECLQQGRGHRIPGHMQCVCGVPATHSSIPGKHGTKWNSSRATVPRDKGWKGIKKGLQHPRAASIFRTSVSDPYTPFHTQLSQNTSWMLLQTQRCPGKHLTSHTIIWIQALSQTQACWIFASSVVIQIGFLVQLPTPQQQHEGKAVLLYFKRQSQLKPQSLLFPKKHSTSVPQQCHKRLGSAGLTIWKGKRT